MNAKDAKQLTLSDFPTTEGDFVEFKSSKTPPDDLGKKLGKTASAFANSAGGTFLAGVDNNTGDADGGLAVRNFKAIQICGNGWISR